MAAVDLAAKCPTRFGRLTLRNSRKRQLNWPPSGQTQFSIRPASRPREALVDASTFTMRAVTQSK